MQVAYFCSMTTDATLRAPRSCSDVDTVHAWLQETYRGCDSRMAQEGLRRHVLRVLRMWRSWSIFSDDFLNGLQVRRNGKAELTDLISWCCSACM